MWLSLVAALQAPCRGIGQHSGPDCIGLPTDHGIAMGQRLLRPEGGVRPAGHDLFPPRAKGVREAVGFSSKAAEEGECHQVGIGVQRYRLHLLVKDTHAVL